MKIGWWFGTASTLPGQKGRRRRQKRLGSNLPGSLLLCFRKETRGERGGLTTKRRSPHLAREGPPPFLASRMPFCPGRGSLGEKENPIFEELIENTPFTGRNPLSFSTKFEMIPGSLSGPFFPEETDERVE